MKRFVAILLVVLVGGCSLFAQRLCKPDLAFPKTVIKSAEKSLAEAEKSRDGDLLVGSLIQLSLAQCAISEANVDTVLTRLQQYQQQEVRPDIRILLHQLEKEVRNAHWRSASLSADTMVSHLFAQDSAFLASCLIKNYPNSVDPGSKEVQGYVTTLGQMFHLLEPAHKRPLVKDVKPIGAGEEPFRVFCHAKFLSENVYSLNEDSAPLLEAYLRHCPKGPFAFALQERLNRYYTHHVQLSADPQVAPGQPITLQLQSRNVKQATIVAYALPDTCSRYVLQKAGWRLEYPVREVARQSVSVAGSSPQSSFQSVTFPSLPEGIYCFEISDDEHPKPVAKTLIPTRSALVTISRVHGFMLSNFDKKEHQPMAVDFWTGEPLPAATFDRHGYPTFGTDKYSLTRVEPDEMYRPSGLKQGDLLVNFFTDLAIYRPGERLQWHFVAYTPRNYSHPVVADETFVVTLCDSRGQELMTDTVTSDAMGQARGTFRLPQGERVPLGMYQLSARSLNASSPSWRVTNHNTHRFEVAEYKAPSFEIVFDELPKSHFRATDSVTLAATVRTLVGVPMSWQQVSLEVNGGRRPLAQEFTTDAQGRFSLSIPVAQLMADSTEWSDWHCFGAQAKATNAGGETQVGETRFYLYGDWCLDPPPPPADADTCPAHVPLWVARGEHALVADAEARISLHTSVPQAHVFYYYYDKDQFLGQGWLHLNHAGRHELKLPMVRKGSVTEMTVVLQSQYHGQSYREQVSVTHRERKLLISTQVMRTQLAPGTQETWRLRAHYDDAQQSPAQARLMLLLYNSALAQLRANPWHLNPQTLFAPTMATLGNVTRYRQTTLFEWTAPNSVKQLEWRMPSLQTWDYGFYQPAVRYRLMDGDAGMARPMLMAKSANVMGSEETAMLESADRADIVEEEEAEANIVQPSLSERVQLRDSMTHVALYEPMLTTDAQGEAVITFPVPADNATWLLQAVAFDRELRVARMQQQVVVKRPVMVKPSLPRFLRVGDKCTLTGLVQNATADTLTTQVQVEVYHPLTHQVLLQNNAHLHLSAHQEQALSIAVLVPDTLTELGFRIVALADGCSDGEQLRLPILPAAQPIVDSYTFFENYVGDSLDLRVSAIRDSLWRAAGQPERYEFEAVTNVEDYLRPQLLRVFDRDAQTATALAHSLWAQVVVSQLCDTVADASQLVTRLNKLQNADGGYSWCDYNGRQSSPYVTQTVMYLMERLETMGFRAPEGLHLDRARKYLKDSTEYYSHTLRKLRLIRRNWRRMSLADRGFAAQYLLAHGRERLARKLALSIEEHLQPDAHYGAYWSLEHAGSGLMPLGYLCRIWRPLLYHDQLALTAHLTEVLYECGLDTSLPRRWMLMSKRTTDWGNSSLVADAAYALLRTTSSRGSDNSSLLTPHSSLVWGALQVSRQVPVRSVEQHTLPEVSLTLAETKALRVGDKVRVTMHLNVTQSMDYVTITIPRPACLEPLRQTSGRFWQSGLFGQCDTRDTETLLYIPHLTSGQHTLSFEAYVTHPGTFAQPAVTLRCEYNPQFTVHSAGGEVVSEDSK